MANSHQLLGDITAAEACLKQELLINPEASDAAVNLGWILADPLPIKHALMTYAEQWVRKFTGFIRNNVTQTLQGVFDFIAHPSCLGVVDPEFKTIDLICRLTREAGDWSELTDLERISATVARG